MSGLSKSEIDTYFTNNTSFLTTIAKGIGFKSFVNYDPTTLITEAYFHVLKNKRSIDTIDKLQRYAIAKIKQEATFYNSETNRKFRIKETENEYIQLEDEDTVSEQITKEQLLTELECILALYKYRKKDSIKRIILEAYTKKGCSSVRKLSNHFNISPASSNKLIKEILEELKELRTFEKKRNETV
jgi:hypothetical protein